MGNKIALVGINGWARFHLNHLKKLQDAGMADFTGCVVLPPEQTAENMQELKSCGCTVYSSLEQLLAGQTKPDLICLPVGIASHSPLTEMCLAHGINVLVEKPVAGCLEDVDRMIAAEKKSGCFAAVGFQHVYMKAFQNMKKDILEGRYGKLKHIHAVGLAGRGDFYYSRNRWAGKLRDASGRFVLDSPANNAFAHHLNLPLFLAGETWEQTAHPEIITGELWRARRTLENFDTCGLEIQTSSGVKINACFSHAGDTNLETRIRVECEKATLTANFSTGKISIADMTGKITEGEDFSQAEEEMFLTIAKKIAGEDTFLYHPEQAREHVFCIQEIYQNLPVRNVPEHRLSVNPENGIVNLHGLPDILEHCFRTGERFSLDNI